MKALLTITFSLLLFTINNINSQNKVLKIDFGKGENHWVMYPPNTKFKLVDNNKITVFSDENSFGTFEINKHYKLEVFPTYKNGKDVYQLKKGFVSIVDKDFSVDKNKDFVSKKTQYSNHVSAKKTITDSKKKKGRKNLILEFTNGITFSYVDGVVKASLNGKSLVIENKYLVYSKLGVTKISFNSKNGETWWVFENKKN